jgi:DNA-directed RNA polymerase I, II, and III subunit RPABC2
MASVKKTKVSKLSKRSRKSSSKKKVVQEVKKQAFEEEYVDYDEEENMETLIETLSGKLKFHIFNPDKYEIESHRNILIVPPDHRKTSEVMTEYEYAEVISHRAKHIENGGPVYVDIGNETDPIVMAEMEILQKKCPLSIRRVHNNLVAELWQVNSMVLP